MNLAWGKKAKGRLTNDRLSGVGKFIVFLAVSQCLAITSAFAQPGRIGTPIRWERYRVTGSDVSILLPKMPVRINGLNPCDEMQSSEFWSYADSTVYILRIVSKFKSNQINCRKTRKFGRAVLEDQVKSLAFGAGSETGETSIAGRQGVRTIRSAFRKTYVFDELEKDRWFELTIVRRSPNPELEARFVSSLIVDDKSPGIAINSGASETLGDEYTPPTSLAADIKPVSPGPNTGKGNGAGDGTDSAPNAVKAPTTSPIIIAGKPRPFYTDAAREHGTEGTVMLRVTFLANGSIGTVTIMKGLENGLTEQAIAAVRKMVFLPAQVNGTNVTVTKQVEYTFSIY